MIVRQENIHLGQRKHVLIVKQVNRLMLEHPVVLIALQAKFRRRALFVNNVPLENSTMQQAVHCVLNVLRVLFPVQTALSVWFVLQANMVQVELWGVWTVKQESIRLWKCKVHVQHALLANFQP